MFPSRLHLAGLLLAASAVPCTFANAVAFTCDASIDAARAGTCATLNGPIANLYSSTFTNAQALIYIRMGPTGLGQTTQYRNSEPWVSYYNALTAAQLGANDATAIASLGGGVVNPVAAGQGVSVTSALAGALGLAGSFWIDAATEAACSPGAAGCYNGIITISDDPATLFYYRAGPQDPNSWDFFEIVEHEVNEVLGTSSCLRTVATDNPDVGVPGVGCTNAVGAADLFRYSGVGTHSYLSAATGTAAYFSINGGVTSIAGYNNAPNFGDYGDWDSEVNRIQNAFGEPGSGGLDITNDGGSEIAVLDAVGYSRTFNATPEPGTLTLAGFGLSLLAVARRRMR
jgi:hypothetical protein